ncbi:MAG: hypothetical protein PF481_03220 [Bacteroidales bacterium]|jgi:hypothetical protein|nr:hypothetical protein [Bacteroidales bacterium]
MKNIFLYSIVVFFFFTACTTEITPKVEKKLVNASDLNFEKSVKIKGADYLMYPVSIKIETKSENYVSKRGFEREIYNIVFYNYKTGEKHLLFDSTQKIKNIAPVILDYRQIKKNKNSKIIFQIIVNDFDSNNDLKAGHDPAYLFMSDDNGKNLTQISPDFVDARSWKFINEEKTLIEVDGKVDSNNDQKFDGADREHIYIIDIENLNNSKEILGQEFQDILKKRYIYKL